MEWWLDFKLITNHAIVVRQRTTDERLQRVRNALLSLAYSRGCIIYFVDFGGSHEQKRLTQT